MVATNNLSTGTIIGIAVAAGVGLLLIVGFAILCCLCFRRRPAEKRTNRDGNNTRMSREEYIPRNEKNLGDVLGTQYRYSRGSDGGVSTGSSLDEERIYDDSFEPDVNPVMSSAGRNPTPPRQAYQIRDSDYHLGGGSTRWTQDNPREMMADYPGEYDRREQSSRRGSREGRRPTSISTDRSSRSSRSSIESDFEEIHPEPTDQAPAASNRNTRVSSQLAGSGGTVLAPAYQHRHESGNWHAYPTPQTPAEDSNSHGEPASPKRYLYPENVRGGEIEEGREDGAHDNDAEHEPQVMNFLPVFSKPVFAQLPGKSGAIVEML